MTNSNLPAVVDELHDLQVGVLQGDDLDVVKHLALTNQLIDSAVETGEEEGP